MKSKRSFETTIFKNVKLFSEWEFNYEWTLTSETDVILGYSVRKAFLETNTKLGKIFAWFSTDIPLSAGPFRYNGLPGLILKISYEKINTTITAIEIVEMKDVDFIEFEKDGLKIDKETIINFDEIVLEKLLNKVK